MLTSFGPRLAARRPATILGARGYAISLKTPKPLPGKKSPRVFKDKKAFQYAWYTRILNSSTTAPLLILHHNEFTAQRLKKLRADIAGAAQKVKPTLSSPVPTSQALPTLTIVRTGIFGAALRDLPNVNMADVSTMIDQQNGGFAVLSLPSLYPPQLNAILRAMDRSVPPQPPKTPEQIQRELDEKNGDPAQPGKRVKRQRQVRIPGLKLMGAIVENRVFLPQGVQDVAKLPSLDTLRAQIVGLLSAPASQLVAVLNEGGGGRLARTLQGLQKGLEDKEEGADTSS